MRMSTPYVGTNDYGILTMTQQEIDEAVEDAHRHNFRVAIHANGDVTIDMVLKAYEKVLAKYPRPGHAAPHRALLARQPRADRAASRRIGAIPTPFWTYAHYHGEKWKEYGSEKMQWMFAHKSFLDAGIPRARRLRLRPGSVRAADGAAEHGHAQGLQRQRLGPAPARHRRRSADDRDDQRRLRVT